MVDGDSELARLGCRLLFTLFGIRPRVRGREGIEGLDEPCLVVCERQAPVDPLLLLGYLPDPIRFLFSGEPPKGWPLSFLEGRLEDFWLASLGIGGEGGEAEGLARIRARLEDACLSLVIFREPGLESWIQRLSEPLGGRQGMPVVPCRITGTAELLPAGAWIPRFAQVGIRLGEPLRETVTPWVLDRALEALSRPI